MRSRYIVWPSGGCVCHFGDSLAHKRSPKDFQLLDKIHISPNTEPYYIEKMADNCMEQCKFDIKSRMVDSQFR